LADNVEITAGAGTVIATDDVGSAHYQYVKLAAGADGTATKIIAGGGVEAGALLVTIASDSTGVLPVVGKTAIVTVTPTLTTGATYVANDYVGTDHTPMSFALARINAGTGTIISAVLVDYAIASVAAELWLFDTTLDPGHDSAAWTITDAESLTCIGVIPFSTYYASANNSISTGFVGAGIPFKAGAGVTTIFACLVTRGAPAYTNGLVSVRLGVIQD
jgi:hypothetical protein